MSAKINIIILAAGFGTRMKSKKTKVLHRAAGMTLIEHAVGAASAVTDPEWITVVVGHQGHEVERTLGHAGVKFVEQGEPRGTGHAVKMCKAALEGRGGLVVITYGDVPLLSGQTIQRLIDHQVQSEYAATILALRLEDPAGYGRLLLDDEDGTVKAIIEEKAANEQQRAIRLVNSGIYCFDAALLWSHIDKIGTDNPANEYYLTDMIAILRAAGHRSAAFDVEDPDELLGVNTRVDLAKVSKVLRLRKATDLMLSGVTIEKPETVTIDTRVKIGMDTTVEPFTRILGHTEIGEDCHISAHSIIEDSYLGDGVQVLPMTMISGSRIESGVQIGPFARLRMENHVESGPRIGNFVELKKTHLGAGAKANHLAYLGDAEIGPKSNIGAGTITCNYDGKHKHKTAIGAGAFIGSNSTLVAPVEVGDGAYVGAGSVVTDPVPAGALALGRGRQVVKEGWVEKKKGEVPSGVK